MSPAQSTSNRFQSGRALDLPEKEWTLMVYMVSDQPTAPDDVDINDPRLVDLDKVVESERLALKDAVEKLGQAGQVHVAVQIDYLSTRACSGGATALTTRVS